MAPVSRRELETVRLLMPSLWRVADKFERSPVTGAGRQRKSEQKPHRQPNLIHHGMDPGAQSVTRTAKGVIRTSFFTACSMLMGAHDRAVDQVERLRRSRRHGLEHAKPDPALAQRLKRL